MFSTIKVMHARYFKALGDFKFLFIRKVEKIFKSLENYRRPLLAYTYLCLFSVSHSYFCDVADSLFLCNFV